MRVYISSRNGIGNFIMLTPMIQALYKHYGNRIDIWFDPEDPRLPAFHDIVDNWDMVARADEHRGYDLVIIPWGEFPPTQAFKGKKSIHYSEMGAWDITKEHEVLYNMRLARAAGYEGPVPQLYCPVSSKDLVGYVGAKRVVIHTGSRPESWWMKKRWDINNWIEICKYMIDKGYDVVFIGGKDELIDEQTITSGLSDDHSDHFWPMCGTTTITETARIIRDADLMLTTDSGPMHIAAAVNTPLIALFGPTRHTKNGPYVDGARVVRSRVDCAPCHGTEDFTKCTDNICMQSISTDIVKQQIEEIIAQNTLHCTPHSNR